MESGEAGATPVEAGATPVEVGVSQPQPEPESACTQQAGGSTPVKPSLPVKPPRPPTGKKPTGRKVSPAWDHFDRVDHPDGRRVAICKYCKRELSAASKNHGTSSLLSHAAGCAKNPNRELRGQKTLSFEPKKEGGEEGFDLVATTFTVEAGRKAIAEMIILDELPFTFVENYGFRKFVKVLQPKFKIIPSRKTIAKEVVSIYNMERMKLKKALEGRRLCLTTDTWTSIQNFCYMCLTCHFIDDDWKLHKRILNFCVVDDHKGETVGRKIELCLRAWGIDSMFTLTVDNASSNGGTIKFLETVTKDWKGTVLEHQFLHMRCCAHILNLIVVEGLKERESSISKVRDAVRYVKSSPNRFQTFKNYVKTLGIESKSLLCLDLPTRWNSTYVMLESAVKFEKVFLRMDFEDEAYNSYFYKQQHSGGQQKSGVPGGLGAPDASDFQDCRLFVSFLKLFYNATKKFSGSLYVTSNTFFDEIYIIQSKILDLKDSSKDNLLKQMATSMHLKFEKYWGEGNKINPLLYVAVVLDSRKKLTFLKFCFSRLYGSEKAALKIAYVRDVLTKLFDYYASMHSPNVEVESVSEKSTMTTDVEMSNTNPYAFMDSEYDLYLEAEQSMGCNNELDKFLAENCEGRKDVNFDILLWWKTNSGRYQVLSKMARDVLAVPVSTVASESAFSTGGRILDPFRSSLSPDMVQVLVCSQNWLKSSVPISLRNAMDEVELLQEEYDFGKILNFLKVLLSI